VAGVLALIEIQKSIAQIADEVARALIRITPGQDAARLSLPLLYPGGSMVGVEISRLREGFLVTDAGGARREAGLMGGEKTFVRLAGDVAERFGVRFDRNMIFEMEVGVEELVVVVASVANAAKTAVENTAMILATTEHADARAVLWEKLDRVYGQKKIQQKAKIRGKSDTWEFDAAVQANDHVALFEVIGPNANAVNSAVTKFLDVQDIGSEAPTRIAVLTRKNQTPHLPVLGRTATLLAIDASNEAFLRAA
jgi:hypothetical protein